ncbi:MAG: cytochrome c [Thiotrichaceae bacterium]|nr:cytochrome c [Thiotrichaceae bacterium]
MNFRLFSCIILYVLYSHTVLAIDPAYEGDNGIRAQVFATHCLFCHSSELTGGQRNGAPSNVNWDTYSAALEKADRAIVRAVDQMSMPPFFSGLPTLNQEQKEAMLAWQQAGFPRIPTNATFDFSSLKMALPVVNVGESVYNATLQLVSIPNSTLGFGFELETAEPSEETSATAATFFPETGIVEMPEIDLLNNDDSGDKVNAQMIVIPGAVPLTFEVILVEFID